MRRIGLLGGTFDPPHLGHLWLGETAFEQLDLDAVWFLPVGDPPHKADRKITAVQHRLQMSALAIQEIAYFKLDSTDATRQPPHSTTSLLTILKERYPNDVFWLLIGADSLRDFPKWIQPQEIIQHCRLGVLPRRGAVINLDALETAVPKLKAAVDWLDGPTIDLSSTAIREWAKEGRSLRFLTNTAVRDYIQKYNLYNADKTDLLPID